jgi:site-specific DNA-methyltransferase (adenine-specific)
MNNKLMFSSISNEWETPRELFDILNREFHFTLDPCATDDNHLCDKYFTIEDDGLMYSWFYETVFCNPPYGRYIGKWVKKCYESSIYFGSTCVMLIPARTDTKWLHDYIYNKAEIRFIKGRLKFVNRLLPSWNKEGNYKLQSAPFPSMIVVFKNKSLD